jgi:hypothetical protein
MSGVTEKEHLSSLADLNLGLAHLLLRELPSLDAVVTLSLQARAGNTCSFSICLLERPGPGDPDGAALLGNFLDNADIKLPLSCTAHQVQTTDLPLAQPGDTYMSVVSPDGVLLDSFHFAKGTLEITFVTADSSDAVAADIDPQD